MTDNRFEKFVNDVSAFKTETERAEFQRIREAAAAAKIETANRLALEALNQERLASNEGHEPVDLWGPEAAALCMEFMSFAKETSGNRRNLLAAEYLRGQDPRETYLHAEYRGILKKQKVVSSRTRVTGVGWRSSGYPIAYLNPEKEEKTVVSTKPNEVSGFRDPKPNIYLCRDGLIRYLTGPLPLTELDGTLHMPVFATWDLKHTVKSTTVTESAGSYGAENTYKKYTHSFSLIPQIVDPYEGLKTALENHALRIRDAQINNQPDI
jgi:hypothetical protein